LEPQPLSAEEVLRIHEILVADFAAAHDPISPPGVRSLALLESAVSRQHTGYGGRLKYPDPIDNAATLLFGICNDHPFHNGNKRTALVSMLVHLDKNKLVLKDTRQKDLFDLLLAVASHELSSGRRGARDRRSRRNPASRRKRQDADEEVAAISAWLKSRAVKPVRGERQVTFRQLRRILGRFNFELAPGSKGNALDVVKVEEKQAGLVRKRRKIIRTRVCTIGYRDEGTFVSLKDLKHLRRMCRLTEADGVDSSAFYDDDAIIDSFINRYRTVLRRLAKR